MSMNPLLNALCATLYISFVASLMFYSSSFNVPEPSVMIPITVLSIFVLSAAVMGFIFLYQPLLLLFENKKKEAVTLFLKTTMSFAAVTILLVSAWYLLSTLYQ